MVRNNIKKGELKIVTNEVATLDVTLTVNTQLMYAIFKILEKKREELFLRDIIFDEFQIIKFFKDSDTEVNYLMHRQKAFPDEDIIGYSDKVFLADIPDSLVGKSLIFFYKQDGVNELFHQIKFTHEFEYQYKY